jgi:imidazolonepropionase
VNCDLLIINIKGLVQVREQSVARVCGTEMAHLPILENAFLAIRDEKILDFGTMPSLKYTCDHTIDAKGKFVLPAFVDSHTHLVFAATREEEFVMKIKGATYEEIAARGGGILNSAKKVQQASEDELLEKTLIRARQIMTTGTGAVEIKSGYGLTLKDELKMLRVAKKIPMLTGLTVRTTLLGAHAVPADIKKEVYLDVVINEMIPAVAAEKLADYIDVFCERGFFSPDETEKIVEEGKRHGLKPRIHANQLHRSGGVEVGVKTKALSVDHLENIGEAEIEALKNSSVIPTLLPGAAFFLGLPFPPARDLITAGLPVAIASDYNPGSAPSGSIPMMISLACIRMKLTPEEAINAVTINTAASLELNDTHGTITIGKIANVVITTPIPSLSFIPYAFGTNCIEKTILNGKVCD